MKKVLMLATTAAMIEQFNKNNILLLVKNGYEVHVAGNFLKGNPISDERLADFKKWLEMYHGKWFHISAMRNPMDLNNYRAYKQVLKLVFKYQYEFIHCHTPIGAVLGRIVAHKTHTSIIYTAHGFHFYNGAPLKNWLLYYPVERFLSRWTDILVLINEEDYKRAKKAFHAKKTAYIPGVGVDIKKLQADTVAKEVKRAELNIPKQAIVLLSVGELTAGKNHKNAIRAIDKIKDKRIVYLICGRGEKEGELRMLIETLGLTEQVRLLGFRTDIPELLQMADLFVFPSLREGLSVALMEAIACKLPVICSKIRGNVDLVTDENVTFDPRSVDEIADCMLKAVNGESGNSIEENYQRLQSMI